MEPAGSLQIDLATPADVERVSELKSRLNGAPLRTLVNNAGPLKSAGRRQPTRFLDLLAATGLSVNGFDNAGEIIADCLQLGLVRW